MTVTRRLAAAIVVFAGLAAGGYVATTAVAGGSTSASSTSCENLPKAWRDAVDIAYDADAGTVTFTWVDGASATVAETEQSCPGQDGLAAQLRGIQTGYVANERESCQELRALLREVRADQRAEHGVASVSRQAAARAGQAAAYDKVAASGQPWTLDVDQADSALADCPR